VWMRKFRSVTLLHVTARLSLLLFQILFTIMFLTPLAENGCTILVKIAFSSAPIVEISIGGILLARIYTIMFARRCLCLCLGIALLSLSALNIIFPILACRSRSTVFTYMSLFNVFFPLILMSYIKCDQHCQWIDNIERCSNIRNNCLSYGDSCKIETLTP